jgi:hypothetical protein
MFCIACEEEFEDTKEEQTIQRPKEKGQKDKQRPMSVRHK